MSYTHFTLDERKYLHKLLNEDVSMRKIAEALGRNVSSVSREIKRNRSRPISSRKTGNKYYYHHWRAQILYTTRRRNQHRTILHPGTEEWNYVVAGLEKYWSPETIAGRWHLEHPTSKQLCVSTIYRYIRKKRFPQITPKTHLRRRGKRLHSKNTKNMAIHPDRTIPEWPEEIRQRARIGDWEGDTVYGAIGKGGLVTQVDRKSRFLAAGLLEKREASLTKDVICRLLDGLPVKSISLDNGSEFSEFHAIEAELNTLIYFAEPHKPWQRGTNENTNDLIRFFFPKGFDFHSITEEDVICVVNLINNRPRKVLGWKTPAEVFFEEISVALD